jgi:hypothetical protein
MSHNTRFSLNLSSNATIVECAKRPKRITMGAEGQQNFYEAPILNSQTTCRETPRMDKETTTFIDAKTRIPSITPGTLLRQRLLAKLRSFERLPLSLVQAPPGFGKSSLLACCAGRSALYLGGYRALLRPKPHKRHLLVFGEGLRAHRGSSGSGRNSRTAP